MTGKITPPHPFLAIEATVYPTRKPELARMVEMEQFVKIEAIRRELLNRHEQKRVPRG